jgi:FixJ family two-component response regulator
VVGHALTISQRTVEIHRASMMKKLCARSLTAAVRTFIAACLDDWPQLRNPESLYH